MTNEPDSPANESRCRLCHGMSLESHINFNGFSVVRCCHCGAGFLTSVPGDVRNQHDFNDYSQRYEQERQADKPRRCWEIVENKLGQLDGIDSILDVGCGEGNFLDIAAEAGMVTYGIEISECATKICRSRGHTIYCHSIDTPDLALTQKFDLCSMWDLLEHLDDPGKAIENVYSALSPGGTLLIVTPMMGSAYDRLGILLYKLSRGYFNSLLRMCWTAEHLFRFHPKGIKKALLDKGFVDVHVEPLIMLSLGTSHYAGGAVMVKWTSSSLLNSLISRIGVMISRIFAFDNKILVIAHRR